MAFLWSVLRVSSHEGRPKANGTEGMENTRYRGKSSLDSRYPCAYGHPPQVDRLAEAYWNPVLVPTRLRGCFRK